MAAPNVRKVAAEHASVARLAQPAYDRLARGEEVELRVLAELIGEASGKGVLRAMHRKYSAVAFDAVLMPILSELGRRKPVRSTREFRSP